MSRREEFEKIGAEAVKARIASGHIPGGSWVEEALAWLADHERSERLRNEASQAEQYRTARIAKNAAIVAAIAAIVTIALAIIGIIISYLAWQHPR